MAKKKNTDDSAYLTDGQTAKDLAKSALVALGDLVTFAEENNAPEEVVKAASRIHKRMESAFGKIVLWEEMQ
jgi:hypothetical protein